MSSLFNTSAKLHNATLLPAGSTREIILPIAHNHELLIKLDPEFKSYTELADPRPGTKLYKCIDNIPDLPKWLLGDTTVTFDAEMTNSSEGLEWIIRAPLGLVQTSLITVVEGNEEAEGKGSGRLWLVEDVIIKGSRMLVGAVKGKCEANWKGIHGRFVEHVERAMRGETPGQAEPAVVTAAA